MIKYKGTITVITPITHGSDEKLGTDTKLRRIKMKHREEIIDIPIFSGNAYRGILRRVAANFFLKTIGFGKETLTDKLYYMLFSGGSLEKGSASKGVEIGEKRIMRKMIPFLSLFGDSYGNQIMAGKLKCMLCIPICTETVLYTDIESSISMWDIIDEVFYTRSDDREDRIGDKNEAQQMKYIMEVFCPGTQFYHEFFLDTDDEIERDCFQSTIIEWQKKPFLGGKSAVGHGKVKVDYTPVMNSDGVYEKYLTENKEQIIGYLNKL